MKLLLFDRGLEIFYLGRFEEEELKPFKLFLPKRIQTVLKLVPKILRDKVDRLANSFIVFEQKHNHLLSYVGASSALKKLSKTRLVVEPTLHHSL